MLAGTDDRNEYTDEDKADWGTQTNQNHWIYFGHVHLLKDNSQELPSNCESRLWANHSPITIGIFSLQI